MRIGANEEGNVDSIAKNHLPLRSPSPSPSAEHRQDRSVANDRKVAAQCVDDRGVVAKFYEAWEQVRQVEVG